MQDCIVTVPKAEESNVGVEQDEDQEAEASSRVLDHRRLVQNVHFLHAGQLAAVVAQAALEQRS